MEKKFTVGIAGLRMGHAWAKAVVENKECELVAVFDPWFEENPLIEHDFYRSRNLAVEPDFDALLAHRPDIVIVASPDQFHTQQSVAALEAGSNVICEKPLAPTLAECQEIIAAVKRTGKFFMTGQVCRYAHGFRLAKQLVDQGRIGRIACIQSEYAHNYDFSPGYRDWRRDPEIGRENILGGGCHAMDLLRWIAGEPEEIFCYTNHLLQPEWPKCDSGFAAIRFRSGAIGRLFVSSGVRAPYSMRTVIHGTLGTIICDNTRDFIELYEAETARTAQESDYMKIPVLVSSHNVNFEFREFVSHLKSGEPLPTDAVEGAKTVAFAEACLKSARSGRPERLEIDAIG